MSRFDKRTTIELKDKILTRLRRTHKTITFAKRNSKPVLKSDIIEYFFGVAIPSGVTDLPFFLINPLNKTTNFIIPPYIIFIIRLKPHIGIRYMVQLTHDLILKNFYRLIRINFI